MKIIATSDLHGYLPDVPPCDLLLIAGDVCPVWNHKLKFQREWLASEFNSWLTNCPARQIVMTWGNHDCIAEERPAEILPFMPRCKVLVDELFEWEGLRIYGMPWQLEFHHWAFNLTTPQLNAKYDAIPACDVILSHGPPLGYGDRCPDGRRVGSQALLDAIDAIEPRLVVFGHIHNDAGLWQRGRTTLANVAHLDETYRPHVAPVELAVV